MSHVFRRRLAALTFELHAQLRGVDSTAVFDHLRRLEWSAAPAVQRWQNSQLRNCLGSWSTRIPFYREHLAQESARLGRSVPSLLQEMGDGHHLTHLPLMDKAAIRAAGTTLEIEGADQRGVIRNHTGGSTGEVFFFLQNRTDERWLQGGVRLWREMLGLDAHCRTAQIWGASIEASTARTMRTRLIHWLRHTQFHSTYELSKDRRREIVRAIHAFEPELLIGYPSSLSAFLPDVLNLPEPHFPTLKAIWSASETLLPGMREDLQRAFGAPVFNNYGCREFGPLGMECPTHEGLHLLEGTYFFEFLPMADGLYEIVVSDLKNDVMPLIRYRTGDLAQGLPTTCSCGRGYRIIRGLEGRRFDLIRGADGEVVTGTFWTLLLRSRPGVQRFQVIQEDWSSFTIRLETTEAFRQSHLDFFREQIQHQFRSPVFLDFRVDEPIEALPSGKFRFIQSKLPLTTLVNHAEST
jgi:phenylacetate-CoA ligase